MRKPDVHASRDEWERYLEGELTQSRAAELERHALTCEACAAARDETRALFDDLFDVPPRLLETDLVAGVLARIEAPPVRRAPRWIFAPLVPLAAAAAIAFAFVIPWGDAAEEFRAKSTSPAAHAADDWVGLTAFAVEPGRPPQPIDGALAPDQALAFAYRNIGPRPFDHLMVFGVSEGGEVYWYYPAYDDASTDPASVPVRAGAFDLPDRVTHALPTGPLHVYGLFTREPRTVRAIEALVRSIEPGERLPVEGAGQHVLHLEVSAR